MVDENFKHTYGESSLPYPSGQKNVVEFSATSHDCTMHGGSGVGGIFQTLKEMDFQRGPWTAAADGDHDAILKYLEKGGEPSICDSAGYTPLHYSARNGHEKTCSLLLKYGASVNSRTRAGKATALHRAAMSGRKKVVALLLRHNADPCAQDTDGKTPLHKAAEAKHSQVCQILIENNPRCADVQDSNGKEARYYVQGTLEDSEVYKVLWWTKSA